MSGISLQQVQLAVVDHIHQSGNNALDCNTRIKMPNDKEYTVKFDLKKQKFTAARVNTGFNLRDWFATAISWVRGNRTTDHIQRALNHQDAIRYTARMNSTYASHPDAPNMRITLKHPPKNKEDNGFLHFNHPQYPQAAHEKIAARLKEIYGV
ncbi:hypothetical protein [Parashewanella tropica]|uniref:hypothetical protein n=1 Tax=Parashewanella tropica TaxID=2547970 RepID=UPI001059F13E|nr:hypothetical protein [Parashewanella tropica]